MWFPERILSIPVNANVLDVGPGAFPHPSANILLEKIYKSDDEWRRQCGRVAPPPSEVPTVFYSDLPFPFQDREFDYVICSHVLEHVDDVGQFVKELTRVARAGYIEYPTIYYEYIYGIPEHQNVLLMTDEKLRWAKKEKIGLNKFTPIQRCFMDILSPDVFPFIRDNYPLFGQGFEWRECVEVEETYDSFLLTWPDSKTEMAVKYEPYNKITKTSILVREILSRIKGRVKRVLAGKSSG